MTRLRGYISGGRINGNLIPQRIQNMAIRGYAESIGATLLLSASEYNIPGSAVILRGILDEYNDVDGYIFYSIWQLPFRSELFGRIKTVSGKENKTFHFALENKKISASQEWDELEDLFLIKAASEKSAESIKYLMSFNYDKEMGIYECGK